MRNQPSLNRRLVLESRMDTPDGMGGFAISWVPNGAHWAQVRVQSARESKIGERDTAMVNYRILVRSSAIGASSRPTSARRFREFERVFNILAVVEYGEDGRFLECWTEEGRA